MTTSLSVLQACTDEHLNASPYPYILIPNALPEKYYRELEAALPARKELVEWMDKDINPLICSYYNTRDRLPQIWKDFFDYHVSADFVAEVVKWGGKLNEKYPLFGDVGFDDMAEYANKAEYISIRNMKKKNKIHTDCQMVNNAPGNTLLVGPHLDNPIEIYAALLYMRDARDRAIGGELEVYSTKGKYRTYGKDRLKSKYVRLENTVPYQENTLVLFFNSVKSFHGVSKRRNAETERRHINIIGEYHKKLFDNTAFLSDTLWDKFLWKAQKRFGKVL